MIPPTVDTTHIPPTPHSLRLRALAIDAINEFPSVLKEAETTAEEVIDAAICFVDIRRVIENPSAAIGLRHHV